MYMSDMIGDNTVTISVTENGFEFMQDSRRMAQEDFLRKSQNHIRFHELQ